MKKLFGERVLWIAIILSLMLRLPGLWEPQLYFDEDVYLTVGMGIERGQLLYRDISDYPNKPPLVYFLAGAVGQKFWARLVLSTWILVSVAVFYDLARWLFRDRKKLVGLSTIVFVLLISTPIFEGNIFNAEVLMLVFLMTGWWVVAHGVTGDKSFGWLWFLGGMCFSVALLFKLSAGPEIIGALLSILLLAQDRKRKIESLAFFLSGMVILPGLSWLYFAWHGYGAGYLWAILGDFGLYFASWGKHNDALSGGGGLKMILLLGWIGLIWKIKSWEKGFRVVLLWFGFSLLAALISGRPYAHYLILAISPVSLLVSFAVVGKLKEKLVSASAIGLFLAVVLGLKFWTGQVTSYYAGFLRFAGGLSSRTEYATSVNGRMAWIPELVSFIRRTTMPGERILVWGNEPAIYYLSGRLPATRLFVPYHVKDTAFFAEFTNQLSVTKPRVVVVFAGEEESEEFRIWLSSNYIPAGQFGEATVFRRMEVGTTSGLL